MSARVLPFNVTTSTPTSDVPPWAKKQPSFPWNVTLCIGDFEAPAKRILIRLRRNYCLATAAAAALAQINSWAAKNTDLRSLPVYGFFEHQLAEEKVTERFQLKFGLTFEEFVAATEPERCFMRRKIGVCMRP